MLSRASTIWISGLVFLGLTIAFGIVIRIYDLHIIDEISDPDAVRAVIASMTPEQRTAHFYMTLILDMPYPLAYGVFYAGLALRFFGRAGVWLALPAFICIPADLIENTVQLLVLAGQENWLWLKALMTPLKLATFIPASLIAVVALLIALKRRLRPAH